MRCLAILLAGVAINKSMPSPNGQICRKQAGRVLSDRELLKIGSRGAAPAPGKALADWRPR
jgi:hypothetical protein